MAEKHDLSGDELEEGEIRQKSPIKGHAAYNRYLNEQSIDEFIGNIKEKTKKEQGMQLFRDREAPKSTFRYTTFDKIDNEETEFNPYRYLYSENISCSHIKCQKITNLYVNKTYELCSNCVDSVRIRCFIGPTCKHNVSITKKAYNVNLYLVLINDVCDWHNKYICTSKICDMYYKNVLNHLNTNISEEIMLNCCETCTNIITNYMRYQIIPWVHCKLCTIHKRKLVVFEYDESQLEHLKIDKKLNLITISAYCERHINTKQESCKEPNCTFNGINFMLKLQDIIKITRKAKIPICEHCYHKFCETNIDILPDLRCKTKLCNCYRKKKSSLYKK